MFFNKGGNVLTIRAFGGFGKTALVKEWILRLEKYVKSKKIVKQIHRVFVWSFYAQGLNIDNVSSDDFFSSAIEYFGGNIHSNITHSQRGHLLASLISKSKSILILDGLEVFQTSPGINEGRIKDEGILILLRSLAQNNDGICIITTRIGIPQLTEFSRTGTYKEYELPGLTKKMVQNI